MSICNVSVQCYIDAPAQQLFDIVADPANHPLIDGSGSVQKHHENNPERLSEGAQFGMTMKIGARYEMPNTVTEFDEPHRIGWQPRSGHTWRYTFEPQGEGTLVTEEWDARGTRGRIMPVLLGFPIHNRRGITRTLERLAELVDDGVSSR